MSLSCTIYPALRTSDSEGGSIIVPDTANAETISVDPLIQDGEMFLAVQIDERVAIGDFIEVPHESEAH